MRAVCLRGERQGWYLDQAAPCVGGAKVVHWRCSCPARAVARGGRAPGTPARNTLLKAVRLRGGRQGAPPPAPHQKGILEGLRPPNPHHLYYL
jgi:hypothetical protein